MDRVSNHTYHGRTYKVLTNGNMITVPIDFNWTNTFHGESVRNWKARISRVLNATSDASGTKTLVEAVPGDCFIEYYTQKPLIPDYYRHYAMYGQIVYFNPPVLPAITSLPDVNNQAEGKFYDKLRRAQTSFQGGVFLGEIAQTIHMLRNPALALRKGIDSYLTAIRKGRSRAGKTTKKRNKYLANTWLEYSFGWAPLINDVQDAYKALRHPKRSRPHIIVVADAEVSDVAFGGASGNSVADIQTRFGWRQTKTVSVRYKGAVLCEQESSHNRELKNWGLSLQDFAPTVWEVIPYSFLVDYFTNIGQVINAVSMRKVHLAWGCRTERLASIREPTDALAYLTPNVDAIVIGSKLRLGSMKITVSSFKRSRIGTVDTPSVSFRLPRTGTQFLNLAALARARSSLRNF